MICSFTEPPVRGDLILISRSRYDRVGIFLSEDNGIVRYYSLYGRWTGNRPVRRWVYSAGNEIVKLYYNHLRQEVKVHCDEMMKVLKEKKMI